MEKKITAYHEGGHTLAAWAMPDIEPIYKVTILARGRTGGHAVSVPEDDKGLMTRSEMIARLVFAMGGRAAEELVFREPTTGAVSDIDQATKIARAMVTEYGMSSKLGAVKYGTEHGDPFLGRTMGTQSDYSHEVARRSSTTRCASSSRPRTPRRGRSSPSTATCWTPWPVSCWRRRRCTAPSWRRSSARCRKRPRLTMFDDFGGRIPSDKPPIKTPGELAIERGEPWPQPMPEPAFKAAIAAATKRPRWKPNNTGPTGRTVRTGRTAATALRGAGRPRRPAVRPSPITVRRPVGTPPAGRPAPSPASNSPSPSRGIGTRCHPSLSRVSRRPVGSHRLDSPVSTAVRAAPRPPMSTAMSPARSRAETMVGIPAARIRPRTADHERRLR